MRLRANFLVITAALFSLFLLDFAAANGQKVLTKDYSYVMEIPRIKAMASSPAHMYVLSQTEGMVVFRTHPDTLQWLYSSPGMEERGSRLKADIRFAYLYDPGKKLTVLEPTSVLGIYSSTQLQSTLHDVQRVNRQLYLAMDTLGLGKLSLSTPEEVDTTVSWVAKTPLANKSVVSLAWYKERFFALTDDGKLFIFEPSGNSLRLIQPIQLSRSLSKLFVSGDYFIGADRRGYLYRIDREGRLSDLVRINEPVKKVEQWHNWLLIKGSSNRIWTSYKTQRPELWKADPRAGNFFTVESGDLWLAEYNKLSKVKEQDKSALVQNNQGTDGPALSNLNLQLKDIKNQVVPYPHVLLLPLQLQQQFPIRQVQFSWHSKTLRGAEIKGQGLYWKPGTDDVGRHRMTVIAISSDGQVDSTSFMVDVKSFNAPPRFTPLRPMTIKVGEAFTLPVRAIDPDGNTRNLIRYLGVDLPDNASIDEQSGRFTWTPTERQVGKHNFQVIATDQYGAASSVDVTLSVVDN